MKSKDQWLNFLNHTSKQHTIVHLSNNMIKTAILSIYQIWNQHMSDSAFMSNKYQAASSCSLFIDIHKLCIVIVLSTVIPFTEDIIVVKAKRSRLEYGRFA